MSTSDVLGMAKVIKKENDLSNRHLEIIEDKEEEYEVNKVVDMHIDQQCNEISFQVSWTGYSQTCDSWLYLEDLNCHDLVYKYLEKSGRKLEYENASEIIDKQTVNSIKYRNIFQKALINDTSLPHRSRIEQRERSRSNNASPSPKEIGTKFTPATLEYDFEGFEPIICVPFSKILSQLEKNAESEMTDNQSYQKEMKKDCEVGLQFIKSEVKTETFEEIPWEEVSSDHLQEENFDCSDVIQKTKPINKTPISMENQLNKNRKLFIYVEKLNEDIINQYRTKSTGGVKNEKTSLRKLTSKNYKLDPTEVKTETFEEISWEEVSSDHLREEVSSDDVQEENFDCSDVIYKTKPINKTPSSMENQLNKNRKLYIYVEKLNEDIINQYRMKSTGGNKNEKTSPRKLTSKNYKLDPTEVNVDDAVKESEMRKNIKVKGQKHISLCNDGKQLLCNDAHTLTGEKAFTCALCPYKCNRKDSLIHHILIHTGEKPYACKLCPYKFRQKSNLTQHVLIHTNMKPFTCSSCPYKSHIKARMTKHMRIHSDEKPFACELCPCKFRLNANLSIHMRTHTGEKPFTCELCPYKGKYKSNFANHLLIHTNKKPFSCTLCHYTCKWSHNLGIHMRIHSDEKPFACELCPCKFRQKGHLTEHMRTHIDEKPFACKLCPYKSRRRSKFSEHVLIHTNMKPFNCSSCP